MRFLKKLIIYLLSFVFICFILPALFTKRKVYNMQNEVSQVSTSTQDDINSQNKDSPNEYIYKNYGTIKLLHTKTSQVEEMDLDTYLYGVVSAEMPASFEKEALKAQAVVARTYTIYKINNRKHDNSDICDDSTCCQAWISKEDRLAKWDEDQRNSNWEKIVACVNETKGEIITYQKQPINAFFHSNSGGTTEIPLNVWGGSNYPYLQAVQTAGEEGYTQYSSEVVLSEEDVLNKLKTKYEDIQIDFNNGEDIKILEYTRKQ